MGLGRKSPPGVVEDEYVATPAGAAASVDTYAAPRQERRQASPKTTTRTSRSTSRGQSSYRFDRLLAEGFVLMLACAMWGLNAVFTVMGFGAIGVAWPLALLFHIGISKGEHYLWRGAIDPVILLIVLGFMVVDVGTTLIGLLQFVAVNYPGALASTPVDLREWVALFGKPTPEWWPFALVMLIVSMLVALASEYLIRKFWHRFCDVWNG
ncbi:MAG: hypothetical protein HC837_07455 [Chloroflexaceae bacterium]|nr:hypothetical protein [Chloroflexaceae bacterium]